MAIDFIPFGELFAPEYQHNYISEDGHIFVDGHIYSVFHNYTTTERQQIFQVCEKFLPWEYTLEQEQWERTMYMYQFIVWAYPFPYPEYKLSEDIKMAITWDVKITPLDVIRKEASVTATRTDSVNPTKPEVHHIITCLLATTEQQLAVVDGLWNLHLAYQTRQAAIDAYVGTLETQAKTILEGRE